MTNTVTVLAESTGFSAVNTIWVLLGAALVFFMQAGFAMVVSELRCSGSLVSV